MELFNKSHMTSYIIYYKPGKIDVADSLKPADEIQLPIKLSANSNRDCQNKIFRCFYL